MRAPFPVLHVRQRPRAARRESCLYALACIVVAVIIGAMFAYSI